MVLRCINVEATRFSDWVHGDCIIVLYSLLRVYIPCNEHNLTFLVNVQAVNFVSWVGLFFHVFYGPCV